MHVNADDFADQLVEVRDIDHGADFATGLVYNWTGYDRGDPYTGLIGGGLCTHSVERQLYHCAIAAIVGHEDDPGVGFARVIDELTVASAASQTGRDQKPSELRVERRFHLVRQDSL